MTREYISRPVTDSVKGIFILFVFYRHIMPYIERTNVKMGGGGILTFGDTASSFLGQLIVVMFLFYSGYGVMNSVISKGSSYVGSIPRHRILTTLLNFMVAVAAFLLLQTLVLHKAYSIPFILQSLIGWESLGNSNWYIFMILLCYLATYIAFRAIKNVHRAAIALSILLGVSTIAVSFVKADYWVDTILAYPFGVYWCLYRDKIEGVVSKRSFLCFGGCLVAFLIISFVPFGRAAALMHNFRSVLFAALIAMITMAIPLKGALLVWLGKNLFPIYIFQRLPMIYLSEFDGGDFISSHPWLYILTSLIITILIAASYRFFQIKIR